MGFRVIYLFIYFFVVKTFVFISLRSCPLVAEKMIQKKTKIVTLVFVIFHKNVLHLLFLSLIYLFLFVGFRVIFRW